jgi:site-specific DNA-methyltransferase (adenine-specific)
MGDGSAARFFYCAKASKKDRNEGLDGFTIETTSLAINRTVTIWGTVQSMTSSQINLKPTIIQL